VGRGAGPQRRPAGRRLGGLTLLEIMVALAIFAGVLAAIYASWTSILRATQATQQAAARVQRERLAVRTLEEALAAVQMPRHNPAPYGFVADTSEEFGFLSFVSRLPESFPRNGRFHGLPVRRVEFRVEEDETGLPTLVLRQAPYLSELDAGETSHPLQLARNVAMFHLEFWGPSSKEWEDEWPATNQLPQLVRFTLAAAPEGSRTVNREDVVTRVVVIPGADTPGAGPGGNAPLRPSPIAPPAGAGRRVTPQGGGR